MNPARFVYLHGFASGPSSSKARWFEKRFGEAGVTLEIPDLAAGDFEHLTITGQLQLAERLLAGAPAVLIGSSMGGYLAALYAARHAEVSKVVLLAPAFGFARRWPAVLGLAETERWRNEGRLELYHYAEGAPRWVHYGLIEDGLRYEDYPECPQPVLVFHGKRDTVVPPELSVEYTAARPNVELVLLDSDHQLLDVLEPVWEWTVGFLGLRI